MLWRRGQSQTVDWLQKFQKIEFSVFDDLKMHSVTLCLGQGAPHLLETSWSLVQNVNEGWSPQFLKIINRQSPNNSKNLASRFSNDLGPKSNFNWPNSAKKEHNINHRLHLVNWYWSYRLDWVWVLGRLFPYQESAPPHYCQWLGCLLYVQVLNGFNN